MRGWRFLPYIDALDVEAKLRQVGSMLQNFGLLWMPHGRVMLIRTSFVLGCVSKLSPAVMNRRYRRLQMREDGK